MRQPFPSESPSQMPPTTLSAPAADSEPRATWAVPPVVLLVDDHPVFSEALAGVLAAQPDFGRVLTAADTTTAQRLLAEAQPGLAIIDVRLGGPDGLSLLAALPTLSSETRAVMLTGNLQRDVSVRARNLGAVAALPKGMGLHELLDALRRVLAGERLFTYDEAAPAPLTAREAEILQLLANGDDPRQAARRLGLSAHTVRDYVRSAREKLGVRTQLAAVVAAAGLGIVELPAPCEA